MKKYKIVLSFIASLWLFWQSGFPVFAQGMLTPHALQNGSYVFDTWDEKTPAKTYPVAMFFLRTRNDVRPSLYYQYFEPYEGNYLSNTNTSTIVGKGKRGISFRNTESGKYFLGGAVLSLNTIGVKDIAVSWNAATLKGSKARWAVRLQYRVGNTGKWEDVTDDKGNPVEYCNTVKKSKPQTMPVGILPESCNNEYEIQLLWRVYYRGRKGVFPEISLENIRVDSHTDTARLSSSPLIITSPSNSLFAMDTTCLRFAPIRLNNAGETEETLFLRCDSVTKALSIHLEGIHADMFHVPATLTADKLRKGVRLPVIYRPKQQGVHTAEIVFMGGEQKKPLKIKLSGSADVLDSINTNLAKDHKGRVSIPSSFTFPVMSENTYRFSFFPKPGEKNSANSLRITYKWYADTLLLSSFTDECMRETSLATETLSNEDMRQEKEYCIPLTAPRYANQIKIHMATNADTMYGEDVYFGEMPYKISLQSGKWNHSSTWSDGDIPHIDDNVFISQGHTIDVEEDAFCNHLFLGDSAKVEIQNGVFFFVADEIYYSSNSSIAVHQNLSGKTWNYICPPVMNVRPIVFSMSETNNETWLMKYNTGKRSQMGDYWSSYIADPKYKLEEGVGYAIYTAKPLDIVYRGHLCNKEVSIPLVATEHDAWNLIGNPFTAPLSTQKLFSDIEGRVQGNAIFLLDKEQGGYEPLVVEPDEELIIAPSESFFVEALEQDENIVLKRSQQHYVLGKQLSDCNGEFLTLNVNHDHLSQYALFKTKEEASLGFDGYDAHKLFGYNSNLPEIYFQIDKEQLSVNVFPNKTASFPICIYIGTTATLTLDAGNLSLLSEGVGIYLEDTLLKQIYPLCHQPSHQFNLIQGTSCGRFILHYVTKTEKAMENRTNNTLPVWYHNNHVYIEYPSADYAEKISVTDKNGNLLATYFPSQSNAMVERFPLKVEQGEYIVEIETQNYQVLQSKLSID